MHTLTTHGNWLEIFVKEEWQQFFQDIMNVLKDANESNEAAQLKLVCRRLLNDELQPAISTSCLVMVHLFFPKSCAEALDVVSNSNYFEVVLHQLGALKPAFPELFGVCSTYLNDGYMSELTDEAIVDACLRIVTTFTIASKPTSHSDIGLEQLSRFSDNMIDDADNPDSAVAQQIFGLGKDDQRCKDFKSQIIDFWCRATTNLKTIKDKSQKDLDNRTAFTNMQTVVDNWQMGLMMCLYMWWPETCRDDFFKTNELVSCASKYCFMVWRVCFFQRYLVDVPPSERQLSCAAMLLSVLDVDDNLKATINLDDAAKYIYGMLHFEIGHYRGYEAVREAARKANEWSSETVYDKNMSNCLALILDTQNSSTKVIPAFLTLFESDAQPPSLVPPDEDDDAGLVSTAPPTAVVEQGIITFNKIWQRATNTDNTMYFGQWNSGLQCPDGDGTFITNNVIFKGKFNPVDAAYTVT